MTYLKKKETILMSVTSTKLTPGERRSKIKNIIRMLQYIEKMDSEEKEKQGASPADLAFSEAFSIEEIRHTPLIQ